MSRSINVCCAAVLAALAGSGCGSRDATGPYSGVRLSQAASLEIAAVLLAEMAAIGTGSSPGAPPGASAAGAAAFLETVTISETGECERGGTITVEGTITENLNDEGIGTLAMDMRQTPRNCVLETSEGRFTVNGDPHLSIAADMTVGPEFEFTEFVIRYGGGFRWTGEPGAGGCRMDVVYDVDFANPEASTITGTVCGYDVATLQ